MRMQCTLLVVIAFFAVVNAFEQAADSKITASTPLISSSADVETARRLRRSHEENALDNIDDEVIAAFEERGTNAAWVSKLAQLDRETWKLRKLDLMLGDIIWLKANWGPAKVFNWLTSRANGWRDIENNKRTIQFFRFTKAYRTKNGAGSFPDYEIYTLLRSKVPEEKLALVFESLKQIPDLKNLAETVQKYQVKLWIDREETPASIAKLLGIPHSPSMVTERGPMDAILTQFTNTLLGDKKKLTRITTMR